MSIELVFRRRVTIEFESFVGAGDSLTKAVGVAKDPSGLGDDGIAVARGAGEGLSGDIAIQAAGIVDRNVIRKAIEPNRGGGLVIPVDDGIEQEFTERNARVIVDHRFNKAAAHSNRTLTKVSIHDQIEGLSVTVSPDGSPSSLTPMSR